MKQVELVRRRAAAGLKAELVRFRVWLSTVDGNHEETDKLRNTAGEALLAMMIECVMIHLGVDNQLTTATDRAKPGKTYSAARKAARGTL